MKTVFLVIGASVLLAACCYRPYPRPCPPAPSYVPPSCAPCVAAKPVKAVGDAVEK